MDAKTLQALKASIKHWEENFTAETPEITTYGPDHCALCQAFYANDCKGCPVAQKGESYFCVGTPYAGAEAAIRSWKEGSIDRDECRSWVKQELNFLRRLLPEGETA